MEPPNSLGVLWNRHESLALCFLIVTVVLWVVAIEVKQTMIFLEYPNSLGNDIYGMPQ
jgi:hypothetical protein